MAEGKKSIVLYTDLLATFEKLNDDEAGRLIKHLFRYVNDLNPDSDRMTEILFEPIKQQLKRDLEKWEGIKDKRSEAGKAGANKRWQTIANAKKDIAKIAVNDNVNVNVIKIEERKQKFALMLKPFVEKYGREFIKDFYLYWSEETQDHKHLKYELEKTWSLERRLSTWASNAKKYGTILPKKTSEEWKPSWL
jgi:predicted RNA-binding protein with RPS1 domain